MRYTLLAFVALFLGCAYEKTEGIVEGGRVIELHLKGSHSDRYVEPVTIDGCQYSFLVRDGMNSNNDMMAYHATDCVACKDRAWPETPSHEQSITRGKLGTIYLDHFDIDKHEFFTFSTYSEPEGIIHKGNCKVCRRR